MRVVEEIGGVVCFWVFLGRVQVGCRLLLGCS